MGRPRSSYGPTTLAVQAQLSERTPRKTSWIARAVGISVDHCAKVLRMLESQDRAEKLNVVGEGIWVLAPAVIWNREFKKPEKARQWWQV